MTISTFISSLFSKSIWEVIKADARANHLPIKALDWHLDLLVSWILYNAKENGGIVSSGYHLFGGWSSHAFLNQQLIVAILKRWLAISESPRWKVEVNQYLEFLEGKGNDSFQLKGQKTKYGILHELRKNPKVWEIHKKEVVAFVQKWYDRRDTLPLSKVITLGFYTLWLHQRHSSADSEAKARECAKFICNAYQQIPSKSRWNSTDVSMLALYMYAAYQQLYEARYISFFISLNKVIQQHALVSPIPSLSGGVRESFPIYTGKKTLWISTEATLLALECFVKEKEYCGC